MGIVRPSTFNLQPSTLATRRSALKGLAGILAAGIEPSLCAASTGGYRRGLGMRMASMGGSGSKPTAREYVQSGLIAMYDAADNGGYDNHLSSLKSWVDLSGNGNNAVFRNTTSFGSDFVDIAAGNDAIIPIVNLTTSTFESVHVVSKNNVSVIQRFNTKNYGTFLQGFNYRNNKLDVFNLKHCNIQFSGNTESLSGTYDSTANPISIMKNSEELTIETRTTGASSYMDFVGKFVIGAWFTYSGSYYGGFRSQNIRIYNRQLSPEDRRHNYAIDNARFGIA